MNLDSAAAPLTDAIVAALHAPEPKVRAAAIASAGKLALGDPSVAASLARLATNDPDRFVRAIAQSEADRRGQP